MKASPLPRQPEKHAGGKLSTTVLRRRKLLIRLFAAGCGAAAVNMSRGSAAADNLKLRGIDIGGVISWMR